METQLFALVAGSIFLFGLVSKRLAGTSLTLPMVFTGLGILLAPLGLSALSPDAPVVRLLAEVTLALVLFGDAARIDLSLLRREHAVAQRLLLLGLPLTLVAGTLAGLLVLPGLPLVTIALLAALLAPTDAALGQAVVASEAVPVRIRQSLNVESGLNDGIVLPAVLVLLAVIGMDDGRGVAVWMGFVALQLILGPLVGVGVGWLSGRALDAARERDWVAPAFDRIGSVAIALFAYALAEVVGGNGFIAVFTAGLTLGNTARAVCGPLLEFAEAEGNLLILLVFLLFGGVLAAPALTLVTLPALGYALLSLTLVRMVPVALSLVGLGLRPATIAFLGWFGPRGIATVLFFLLVLEEGVELPAEARSALILTVLLSIVLHGLSAGPWSRAYGAHVGAADEAEMMEVEAMPLRQGDD